MTTDLGICNHCHKDIALRNPSGFCDHLYYPENCKVCYKPIADKIKLERSAPELLSTLKELVAALKESHDGHMTYEAYESGAFGHVPHTFEAMAWHREEEPDCTYCALITKVEGRTHQ